MLSVVISLDLLSVVISLDLLSVVISLDLLSAVISLDLHNVCVCKHELICLSITAANSYDINNTNIDTSKVHTLKSNIQEAHIFNVVRDNMKTK